MKLPRRVCLFERQVDRVLGWLTRTLRSRLL
jgi:hypothetical protein